MFSKNNLLFLLITLLSCNLINAEGYKKKAKVSKAMCKNARSCADLNKNCLCYCSYKGGPRKKHSDDQPVYVENDREKWFCYCKPWDLKNYPGPVTRD